MHLIPLYLHILDVQQVLVNEVHVIILYVDKNISRNIHVTLLYLDTRYPMTNYVITYTSTYYYTIYN